MIRLSYADRSDRVTLDFGTRFTDRDAIRDVLNRLQSSGGSNAIPNANSSKPAQSAQPTKPVSPEEFARRAKLMAHKEVRKLHVQLVGGNVVSDEDFWAAMRWRYKDNGEPRGRSGLEGTDDADEGNSIEMTGERGVPSDAFAVEDGAAGQASGLGAPGDATAKWTSNVPTPAQRHLVFMEKPAVARAYKEKVKGGNMDDKQFWMLFVSSSLAGRRIGRMTKSDTARTAEADAMFAPFEAAEKRLGEKEAAEQARKLAHELDLDHADDHRGVHVQDTHREDSGVSRGIKRGRDTAADASSGLRLMRLVNRHGKLVMDEGGVGGWIAEGIDKVRPLEDLVIDEEKPFSKLGVRGVSGLTGAGDQNIHVDIDLCCAFSSKLSQWNVDVERFRSVVAGSDRRLEELLSSMRP